MKPEIDINYTLEKFEELVTLQDKALNKANDVIDLKNQYIDLLEDEIRLRKKQNFMLSIIIMMCFIAFVITLSLYCIS